MRAVHVHRIAGVGGSERHLLTLLPALRKQGVETAFVGLDVPGSPADRFYAELERASVPFRRLASARGADPVLVRRLARAIRDLDGTLVHTHLVHADVTGALAAIRLGLPLVSTKHNDDPFRVGPLRHLERLLTRRAGRVIAITEALRAFLVDRVGLPASKVTVVHYGLDDLPPAWGPNPQLELPPRARVLFSCARLVEQKGLETLVRALPAIRAAHPEAIALVAGEGPERPRLERLAAELGVGDALLLPGRAGDVAAFYRAAEMFVHPARWEGFGLVLLEAMLAGLPVVASAVSSIPEICRDGETGSLVRADDPSALAAAVLALLDDPEEGRRLGAGGRERARAWFSVTAMAERTAALYEPLLRRRVADS